MRLIIEEYGLLVVSICVGAIFLFFFARLISWNHSSGLRSIFNSSTALGGSNPINYLLSGAKMDDDGYIVMNNVNIQSSAQKLYRYAGKYDLESFETPKFKVLNGDNFIIKAIRDGSGNVIGDNLVWKASDWTNQIGISSEDGLPITVLVSEYTPITSTSPKAVSDGSIYYLSKDGNFVKYLGGGTVGASGERQDGVVLYTLQTVYDEFGNRVVEDGKIKQSMQVAYDDGVKYSQEDIVTNGVVISYDIAKKYKVTYRIEKGKIKSEYNAVFVNETRELGTSEEQIRELFEQLYKKTESGG